MWTRVHIAVPGGRSITSRKDVAEKAGVSLAVVSRVLNESGYVAESKRQRVLDIVRQLGYRPHPVAVSLKKKLTRQILYYVQDLSNSYYMAMYRGISAYAKSRGYNVLLSGVLDYPGIRSLMVDGVILPTEFYGANEFLDRIEVPVVVAAYGSLGSPRVRHVDADVTEAVRLAVSHLTELGHRRIGFLSLHADDSDEPRPAAFRRFTKDLWGAGLSAPFFGPATVPGEHQWTNSLDAGIVAGRQYLESDRRATAFVAFNDDMAIGFMSEVQKNGVAIPKDLSVAGIDGHPGGAYSFPSLTSVSLDPDRHGSECARVVIDIIEGAEPEPPDPIVGSLIVRDSTGKPRA